MNNRVQNLDGTDGKVGKFMGFINLLTIDDYVKESEKYIYEKYGIKKEELQIMQTDELRKLTEEIIGKYIDVECFKNLYSEWYISKTYKGIKLAYNGDRKKYAEWITKQCNAKTSEDNKKRFLNDMKSNLTKVIAVSDTLGYNWCDLYLLLKYTKMKDKTYDAYENSAYFTNVDENDLPITINYTNSNVTSFGREFQRNLYNENITIFSELYGNGEDITRYGFWITRSIVERVERCVYIKEQGTNIEELILLDNILGVSLTNIFFCYNKKAPKEKWNSIIDISKKVACIKSGVGRNLLGEMISVYMMATEYDGQVIDSIKLFLEDSVSSFNHCFEDLERLCFINDYSNLEEVLSFLEKQLLKSGYLVCKEKGVRYRFAKMKKITEILKDKKRIKVSKIKRNNYELYALIHRAVLQGIVETNRGSAKK